MVFDEEKKGFWCHMVFGENIVLGEHMVFCKNMVWFVENIVFW